MESSNWINLLGGLGIFLYGMKLLSEALQYVAGENLRNFLAKMTKNRFTAIISGIFVTCAIQSSSATTVLVVGFVNAALLNLVQAIGVIMGANIGTTITAWIISFVGFKMNVSLFALPAIIVGISLHFFKRNTLQGWGDFLIGFGLLFLGLDFMKNSIPDSAKSPDAFNFLQQYSNLGFMTVLIFVVVGTLLTIVVQSSSASTTITITLAFSGIIPLEAAYGMILGENIGTTITANLAAIPGNANAKKAALAHTIFNVFGVIWVLILFNPIMAGIDKLIPGDPIADVQSTRFHISAFHSLFNITNTILLVWFIPQIALMVNGLVNKITGKQTEDGLSEIKFLSAGSIRTTDIAIAELSNYTKKIIRETRNLFVELKSLIRDPYDSKKVDQIFAKEEELDRLRAQILVYLSETQEAGVHGSYAKTIVGIMERIKAIEEIGDNFANAARKIRKAHRDKIELDDSLVDDLVDQVNLVLEHYDLLCNNQDRDDNFLALGDPKVRTESRRLREQAIKMINHMENRAKKKKFQKKVKFLPILHYKDLSRNIDNVSRQLNVAISADN
ncbi:Na/Pi cotransporter family protein [Leptospira sp. GIMC2001]|uniref:Na/Pi cotransporter family protein n=1 Tax=Leptospira sp. GIMC2001 TaxID=1513297 RepID=UPI00234B8407|nr:Na/Pi cotransporter family protein [Leptospira sp. GIMC2001]WCL49196.1 Na/Pi cotransporter family protein [Leptospira sp. GIMC2001]